MVQQNKPQLPGTSEDKSPGVLDWTIDGLFRSVIGAFRLLPYRQRLAAMDRTMRRVIAPNAGYTGRAINHLRLVFPELPAEQIAYIAERSLGNNGRTLMELYSGRAFSRRMANTQLNGPGVTHIEAARAAKRPVLFVTGHFGNHEAPRHALVERGYDIGGLYRPMSNPYFNAHYARTMADYGGPVFPQGRRGTLGFMRHLSKGGMATLLFDVWSAEGEQMPFMGLPADTSLAAAQIAQRTGALLIPYFGIRNPDGVSFDIQIEEPIAEGDPSVMMGEATRRLEYRIRSDPEQYFWVHRRWKPLS